MQQSTGLAENWTGFQLGSVNYELVIYCVYIQENCFLDKDMEEVAEIKASPDYNHEHRGFHHLWVSLLISNLRELPP